MELSSFQINSQYRMVKVHFCVLFLVTVFLKLLNCDSKHLSRKKRYLTFPEGASVSVAVCMTAQTWYVRPPGIFTESIAWGLGYDLPNDTKEIRQFYPKPLVKRRQRRDLYGKVEKIMESMGYNGRSCILRSLCEASRTFRPKQDNLVDMILAIVFRYPAERILSAEPEDHRIYHWASQMGRENKECSEVFSMCPFSLIDMALGYYSYFT